jgi:hypothetical protein
MSAPHQLPHGTRRPPCSPLHDCAHWSSSTYTGLYCTLLPRPPWPLPAPRRTSPPSPPCSPPPADPHGRPPPAEIHPPIAAGRRQPQQQTCPFLHGDTQWPGLGEQGGRGMACARGCVSVGLMAAATAVCVVRQGGGVCWKVGRGIGGIGWDRESASWQLGGDRKGNASDSNRGALRLLASRCTRGPRQRPAG